MIDWFTTTIVSTPEGLTPDHAHARYPDPQRRSGLLGGLWGRHPPGRAGRMQSTDRLRARPSGPTAVRAGGHRVGSGPEGRP